MSEGYQIQSCLTLSMILEFCLHWTIKSTAEADIMIAAEHRVFIFYRIQRRESNYLAVWTLKCKWALMIMRCVWMLKGWKVTHRAEDSLLICAQITIGWPTSCSRGAAVLQVMAAINTVSRMRSAAVCAVDFSNLYIVTQYLGQAGTFINWWIFDKPSNSKA